MGVGVLLPRDLRVDEVRPFVLEADRLGFDELWVVEDCFYRGGVAQAAVALSVTTRIHVGIGILPAAARNPVFTTLEVATLAELFPGRLTVGVGHGMPDWMRQVGAWPASPLTLLEEHLVAIRTLLHGGTVRTSGRYVRLDDVRLDHPPAVPPPVLAGVRGPRSLAVSGRCADGTVLAEPITPEYLQAARAQLDAQGPHRLVGYAVAAVDDDVDAARAVARRAIRWVGEPDVAPHLVGLPFAEDLAALRARHTDLDAFADALPDAWVDRLTLCGDAATVRARITELHGAGADCVVLVPVGADRPAALRRLASALPQPD